MSNFLGVGFKFPFSVGPNGGIQLSKYETNIEESVRIIIGTALGERQMRPEWGCRIHDFVFAPADSTTAAAMSAAVTDALNRWEHRIDVENVDVLFAANDPTVFYIDIHYRMKRTNDRHNLVFPFYVIPGE